MPQSRSSSSKFAVTSENYPSEAEVESYWHEALSEVPKNPEQ